MNADSLIEKLKNIGGGGHTFQKMLYHYIHEGVLRRLSLSSYTNHFLLKGGILLYGLGNRNRPTKDVDLLGKNINSSSDLKQIWQELLSIQPDPDDLLRFDTNNITTEIINETHHYQGLRLKITADLFGSKVSQRITIEIAFGDVITPEPQVIDYPCLLPEWRAIPIKINAYNIETVIAEKSQAIVSLGTSNSRMKDFFDVYTLLQSGNYDVEVLHQAIHRLPSKIEILF